MGISGKKIFVLAPALACAIGLSAVTPAGAAAFDAPAPASADAAFPAFGPLGPLTDLAIKRLLISDHVAAAKFGTDKPIDDPVREQQIRDAVRQQAILLGIDPEATVAFFDAQINASKIVQRGLFAYWTDHPDKAPTSRPDLNQIRIQLDQLTTDLLTQLVATNKIRHHTPSCEAQLLIARISGEITHRLDPLHRKALGVALDSVCTS